MPGKAQENGPRLHGPTRAPLHRMPIGRQVELGLADPGPPSHPDKGTVRSEAFDRYVRTRIAAMKRVPGYADAFRKLVAELRLTGAAQVRGVLDAHREGGGRLDERQLRALRNFSELWDTVGLGPVDPEDPQDVGGPAPSLHSLGYADLCIARMGIWPVCQTRLFASPLVRPPFVRVDIDLSRSETELKKAVVELRKNRRYASGRGLKKWPRWPYMEKAFRLYDALAENRRRKSPLRQAVVASRLLNLGEAAAEKWKRRWIPHVERAIAFEAALGRNKADLRPNPIFV